ncbi:MAG TPA: hypothetical protein VL126_00315 [Bacteroidota bacterium]|nr:hypothetical protein [Bacteroidota bacterium]
MPTSPAIRRRLVAAIVMGICALALGALQLSEGPSSRMQSRVRPTDALIGATLDSLYTRFGIDRSTIRSRTAKAGGVPSGRREQRVLVGKGFDAIQFNVALGRALSETGAHVVASEQSREATVTMHIVSSGRTIWSVLFAPDDAR